MNYGGMAIVWEAPKSAPPSTCLVPPTPHPHAGVGSRSSAVGFPTHLSHLSQANSLCLVPSSLITSPCPSFPALCSPSGPSLISTWPHCPPQFQSRQQLLFTHQILTPKSTSGLKVPGSKDQGSSNSKPPGQDFPPDFCQP